MYDSVTIGEYLAVCANSKGVFINQTKLQKLLYILYGAYLTLHNERLVSEQPKAWPYGPVFPRVQKKFTKGVDLDCVDINSDRYVEIKTDTELNLLINNVLDTFGEWTAQALSEWSHKSGSPWAVALANNNNTYNAVIQDDTIKEYFKTFMNI